MSSVPVLHNARNLARLQAEYDHRVDAMESRIQQLDKENSQVHFMNKQLSAQIRKLERENRNKDDSLKRVKMCAACLCLNNSRRNVDAKPQQAHSNAARQPNGEQTEYFEVASNPPPSYKSGSSGLGSNLSNVLLQKDRTILDLKDEVCVLKAENQDLVEKLNFAQRIKEVEMDTRRSSDFAFDDIQDKLQMIERDLHRMKQEKKNLVDQLSTKETNLLRCEKLLKANDLDRKKLNETIERMKIKETGLISELQAAKVGGNKSKGSMLRSKSENYLPASGQEYRKTSANQYCAACRQLRGHQPGHARSRPQYSATPLKRTASRTRAFNKENIPAKPTIRQMTDGNRQLTNINEMLKLNEDLLKSEIADLKMREEENQAQIRLLRERLIGQGKNDLVLSTNHSKSFTRLEQENSALKTRLDKATSQAAANEAFLEAQKIRLEQDVEDLQRKNDRLRISQNTVKAENQELQLQIEHVKLKCDRQRSQPNRSSVGVNSEIQRLHDEIMDLKDKLSACEAARRLAVQSYEDCKVRLTAVEKDNSNLRIELSMARSDQHFMSATAESGAVNTTALQALIAAKDQELSRLKQSLSQLDTEYSRFRTSLASQEENLIRLQNDLSITSAQKVEAEAKCTRLENANKSFNERCSFMSSENEKLTRQLSQAVDEQDSLRRAVQRYIAEIQNYEALLGEKERERVGLLETLRENSVERSALDESKKNERETSMEAQVKNVEIEALKKELILVRQEKFQLEDERSKLEQQLLSYDLAMGQNRNENQNAVIRIDLLNKQIEDLRTAVERAGAEKDGLQESEVKLQTHIAQLQHKVEDATAELTLCRNHLEQEKTNTSTLQAEMHTCRSLQTDMATELQKKEDVIKDLRAQIDDCKTQLDLQADDLKRIRKQMEDARDEAGKLRRDLSHEKYEKSQLQQLIDNNSTSKF